MVDTHDAVLLDGVNVALVEPYREGRSGSPMLAMVLRGRINKSSDRAEILWLFDEDGAAGVITELLALASRIGPGFAARIVERIDELKSNGALG